MLQTVKGLLPRSLKNILKSVKQKSYDQWQKKRLFKKMKLKHVQLIEQAKSKKEIKVIFLAIHKSVWKVDPVFKKMLSEPLFKPVILVCPYTQYGEVRMWQDMKETREYFEEKGYPVITSFNEEKSHWLPLSEIKPDIVFFTNPYDFTRKEYYEDAYLNYLSCYVPYYFMATTHAGSDSDILSTNLLTSVWRIFSANDYVHALSKKLSANNGHNCYNYGYPATEILLANKINRRDTTVWKKQKKDRKRIIFAPHHTIENTQNSLSSFLIFGELLKIIAISNSDEVQWSFKPHPILKSKLYIHPSWGKQKTDDYFNFWETQDYTQLDDGEYEELFLTSDAIIHDCSSFIVEYAFTGKPCLYLINENNLKNLLNDFGRGVIDVYEQARKAEEIEGFVGKVISESIVLAKNKRAYFDAYVDTYYNNKLPSERIVENIKESLGI